MDSDVLAQRIATHRDGWLNIHSALRHFMLINYAVPVTRLRPFIPPRFDIPTFPIGGEALGMLSVVPFWDGDFNFTHLTPWLKFAFPQTNYRLYVTDRETGEQIVWFWGTTLGARWVYPARWLWRIPWHYAPYQVDCRWDGTAGRYTHLHYQTGGDWAPATIQVYDTGEPLSLQPGFADMTAMKLLLTHPVQGYYERLDGRLGGYSVWHEEIPLTLGRAEVLHFGLLERLGVLTAAEMGVPHSIFICPEILFKIEMPPRLIL